ncbi:MAG: DNA primase, partial [Pseudomonadota bacterium]
TGNLETQEYRVEGPVMLFSTTTAIDIDEELMNRCLVLSVDESREQTEAIHNQQRKKRLASGLQTKTEKHQLLALHQNAQRLLRPLAVVNPYAEHLTFLSDRTRTRRDHEKYLSLIDSITFLHQYQRDIKQLDVNGEIIEYIEATIDDIGIANQLANEVLGHSLDELPPQTRKLLNHITRLVESACANLGIAQRDYRFSRKAIRAFTHWSDPQVKRHTQRLVEMEYLLVHQGKRGQSYEYELLYNGEPEQDGRFMMGLIDIESLYQAQKAGLIPDLDESFSKLDPLNTPPKRPKYTRRKREICCNRSTKRNFSRKL